MKPTDMSVAKVLHLSLVEGVSVRQIAHQTHLARRAVRQILGRQEAPPSRRLDLDATTCLFREVCRTRVVP
jgi:hypothetical protein